MKSTKEDYELESRRLEYSQQDDYLEHLQTEVIALQEKVEYLLNEVGNIQARGGLVVSSEKALYRFRGNAPFKWRSYCSTSHA